MNLLFAAPQTGITFLIVLLVVVFFQVIIHNVHETKRFKRLDERLKNIEDKLFDK